MMTEGTGQPEGKKIRHGRGTAAGPRDERTGRPAQKKEKKTVKIPERQMPAMPDRTRLTA